MVCTLSGRGARAEDPFRGLRAGPVRLSPTFYFPQVPLFAVPGFFRTFADLPKTPQTHPIGEGVSLLRTSILHSTRSEQNRATIAQKPQTFSKLKRELWGNST